MSIELVIIVGVNQENLDPNTFISGRFWVVSMRSSFLKVSLDHFEQDLYISTSNPGFDPVYSDRIFLVRRVTSERCIGSSHQSHSSLALPG